MIVKNRQQMAQLLNERMTRTYTTLSERQELEPDTSLVKTYLLEAHLSESSEPVQALKLAEEAFSEQSFEGTSRRLRSRIRRADEATLISAEVKFKNEILIVYVDFTNPRYWFLHSMGSSNTLDWVIGRLVKARPELDRAWLPADFLERVSTMGSFRGLGLDYDRRIIPDVDFDSQEAPVEFLKMQLWASDAGRILRTLRKEDAFPNDTTLSKVKVKFWLDGESDGDFSLDDIKYDGKVTARGTSFQSHIALVSKIYEDYANQIRELEEKYALRAYYQHDGRLSLDGEPVNFRFKRPIANIEVFCESVFSCGEPFRLWGVPVRIAKDFYRVQAIDLHVGGPIQFEIAPEFMRLYLPVGSCGNSVLRLYTNLQHHYDALVRAQDGDGRRIFEF
jgi:hypothetical protein